MLFKSRRLYDQIYIALYLKIFVPEFERVFGNENCEVLICLTLCA